MQTENRRILALTGRRDLLSDGVWDYCTRLADALHPHGVDCETIEIEWEHQWWLAALRKLQTRLTGKPCEWASLQYTAMAWSRRGFPFGALAVAWLVKKSGAKLVVVFHEPRGFRAGSPWARFRCTCQQWVVQRLYSLADVGIFTVLPSTLPWLRHNDAKACFIPIGSNVPENLNPRGRPDSARSRKTIAVFCVTNLDRTAIEVAEIAAAVRHVRESVPHLRLIVFGRGAREAQPALEQALVNNDVELSILGVLPIEEITRILSESDALLYVRDTLNTQHGSSLAAVACGLPLVAYGDETLSFPLNEAGILLARPGDQQALCAALKRVLTDDALWASLHQRSLDTYKRYFAWEEIARRYVVALDVKPCIQPAIKSVASQEPIEPSYRVTARSPERTLRTGAASDAR